MIIKFILDDQSDEVFQAIADKEWRFLETHSELASNRLFLSFEEESIDDARESIELIESTGFNYEYSFACPHCDEPHDDIDDVFEIGNGIGCHNCTVECEASGDRVFEDETTTIRGRNGRYSGSFRDYTCHESTDYSRCELCDCNFFERHVSGCSGTDVCDECRENGETFCCNTCGEEFINSEMADSPSGGCFCEGCYEEQENELVVSYNEEIDTTVFGKRRADELTLGIELEVISKCSSRDEDAEKVIEGFPENYVILKEDGSIGSKGFEIVTRPGTLETHRKQWEKFLDSRPKTLISHNDDRCGLHVHIGRDLLSDSDVEKIVSFCNSVENKPFIVLVCGRESTNYAAIAGEPGDSLVESLQHIKKVKHATRYSIINLQNSDTVEFRGFKGTLNRATFLRRIEFVEAMVRFCKSEFKIRVADSLAVDRFISFCWDNRKLFPELTRWLSREFPDKKPWRIVDRELSLPALEIA